MRHRSGRQVYRISRGNSILGANPSIAVSRFGGEFKEPYMVAFEVVAKLARDLRVSRPIGACQDFSQCKDGSAKLVPTLQHPVTNVLHLLSELRAVFQP